jgi:hypothetical protein
MKEPDAALWHLITALWRGIPAANNGFTTNIMQAISAGSAEQGYESNLIKWSEARIAEMLRRVLTQAGAPRANYDQLAHVLFMAFDGFSINYHLNPWAACSDEAINLQCQLLLRGATRLSGARAGRAPAKRGRRR